MWRTMLLLFVWMLVEAPLEAADFPYLDPAGSTEALLVSWDTPTADVLKAFSEVAQGRPQRILALEQPTAWIGIQVSPLDKVLWYGGAFDEKARESVAQSLSAKRDHLAVWLEPGAALAVSGRQVRALGTNSSHLFLAASGGRPLWHATLKPGDHHDWVMLQRAAIERARADFPPSVPPQPLVENGALVIAGGGALPQEIVQAFIDLAGGIGAPIVVLPIAAGDTLDGDSSGDTRLFTRAGATNVRSLRARSLSDTSDEQFVTALRAARGVWFGGGRQWRFVDAYFATPVHELLQDCLRRGGVIGGSSAGASIQGQYMPRGSPLGNTQMMAEGYERGLGFLPGVAIDQHLSARRRHADMTRLMSRYPQLLGIGIDEGTALVVRGENAKVIGGGNAYFYDHRCGVPGQSTDHLVCQPGTVFDLQSRRALGRGP